MRRLSIEELQEYPYPNLMAEIIESGYSICTVGEHMGLGRYLPEDSPEIWDRLTGNTDILFSEATGLARLFGADFDYLFSHGLRLISEKPYAYWRWLEENKRRKRELVEYRMRQKIDEALKEKPYLLKMVSIIVSMSEEEVGAAMDGIMKGGAL